MPWQMTDSMLATRHSQSSFSGIANCVSPSQAPTTDRKAGSKHKGKARFSRLCGVLRWIAYDLSGPYRTRTPSGNTGESSLNCQGSAECGADWPRIRALIELSALPEAMKSQLVSVGDSSADDAVLVATTAKERAC